MTVEEQNKLLKNLVIFLAGCYQENYDTFACPKNYSTNIRQNVKPKTYQIIINIFNNFSMVQGTSMRDIIERIAHLNTSNPGEITVSKIDEIFNVNNNMELRQKIYNEKYGKEADEKTLEKIQELWEPDVVQYMKENKK